MLYQKIVIPDYEIKQRELIDLVDGKFKDQSVWAVYDPPKEEMAERCPSLYSYIIEKSKLNIRFFRIYSTPANGSLNPHVDGGAIERSPIGLNLPILNCDNSLMKWWDGSNAKIVNGNFGYGNIPACRITNESELKCIAETEINQPTFVRTDFIHSVENYNPNPRVLMSVRWVYNKVKGQFFHQVMDYESL